MQPSVMIQVVDVSSGRVTAPAGLSRINRVRNSVHGFAPDWADSQIEPEGGGYGIILHGREINARETFGAGGYDVSTGVSLPSANYIDSSPTILKLGNQSKYDTVIGPFLPGWLNTDTGSNYRASVRPPVDCSTNVTYGGLSYRVDLGDPDYFWHTVYATSYYSLSDERSKDDVEDLDEKLGLKFLRLLEPKSYKHGFEQNDKNVDKDNVYMGFLGQQVKALSLIHI